MSWRQPAVNTIADKPKIAEAIRREGGEN